MMVLDDHKDQFGVSFDDNKKIHGRMIHGKEVFGKVADLVEHITEYDEALICCPNAPRKDIYRIIYDT